MKHDTLLHRGLDAMGIVLPAPTRARLLRYLELLDKWNRAYNLTAVRDIEQMVPKHLLDSLSILPHLRGAYVLDVGTGAGLPGIPLALARPDVQFRLVDGNAKKLRFVRQAIHDLQLTNVAAVHSAVEQYRPDMRFDCVVARALAAIPDMLASVRHLIAPQGVFLAMKGVYPEAELVNVGEGFRVREVVRLTVAGLDAERHVVILEPVS
jgi:16S rRNA (guanine527-N7)-methyltransferase